MTTHVASSSPVPVMFFPQVRRMSRQPADYSCPSAQPDTPNARVFGVVLGDVHEPRVAYLEKGVAVTPEMLDAAGAVSPTRILRFSGTCANSACGQFKNGGCRLGKDILKNLEPVVDRIPPCTIRATCRWFAENGPEVCLRCARVTTSVHASDATLTPIAEIEGVQRVSLG